jgi:glycosyltransferase involved in cell wall biosynthesis
MTDSFTLAHFSDVHLSPIAGFTPRYWNAKRALGFMNWQRGRKAVHRRSTADRLIADALALRVDHIAITGDLINLGLPAEYEAAADWLRQIGPPERVTVIPGNHDVYTHIGGDAGIWHLFADLPEERRSFASMMPFEAYPSLLAHFDVLLAPLCDNDFNNAKSDIKLLEAGIRRIPWVASPRAAYRAWGVGGLFAEAPGEWQSALTRLAQDANLRRQLGQDGRERANTREARSIAERWLAALGLNGA